MGSERSTQSDPVVPGPEDPDFDAEDAGVEPPPTALETASDVVRGLLALLALSIGVIAAYVAGGVAVGLLSVAAPVVIGLAAALLLARYLSRNS